MIIIILIYFIINKYKLNDYYNFDNIKNVKKDNKIEKTKVIF